MLTFLRKWYASISWYEIHPKHATYCFSILLHSYNITTKQRYQIQKDWVTSMIRMKLWVFLAVLVKIFFLLKALLHKWHNCSLPLTLSVINIALKGQINIHSVHTSISPARFCLYAIQIHPHFQTARERGFLMNKYMEQLKWMPMVESF